MIETLTALLRAEAIKLRRSAPLRLAIAAPGLLLVLEVLTMFSRGVMNQSNPARLWNDLLTFGWILWLGLFTPALIALEAVCLVQAEHAGRHWKQLFALPVPRWQVFTVKMLSCGLLLAVSFVVFAVTSTGAVLLFGAARGLHLAGAIPWADIGRTAIQAFAACWLLIVIHTWISARFPGFAVAASVGFTAMLVGFLLVTLNPKAFGRWYPWTLPINVRPEGLYASRDTLAPAVFGALSGVLLAPLASWDLGRRGEQL